MRIRFFFFFKFLIIYYFWVNIFRVFVGTWNVAGRSPVGSLAADLDEWLNLREDAVDIYVLGYVCKYFNVR